jgi:NADH dehydrogenase (ubiquinone) Fe-S protein 1
MLKIYVNNIEVIAKFNTTVLEACESIGIEIPRFCYHEKLSIAGNCRMCLVEIEKSPKPVVSCAMPVMNGMKIYTDTPLVKKAREGVLEFLLLNHPLDCPICDQGGECDLQDQAMMFGNDRSRFYDFKRGVEDKNIGLLIKTIMTRCIHCTRCVRFAAEIAGIEDLGTTSRGTTTEIGSYIKKIFQSELSGNVIDLCPVGALTSRPYAFKSRSWELKTAESIDITDGIGSNIRIDFNENEVKRVLPILNEEINSEWISDKTRFSFDGLTRSRLVTCSSNTNYEFFVPKNVVNSSVLLTDFYKSIDVKKHKQTGSWSKSLIETSNLLKHYSNIYSGDSVIGICGTDIDLETQLSFKEFINSLGSEHVLFDKKLNVNSDFSSSFTLNKSLSSFEKVDCCLLIGTNPRYEAALLNVRLRKQFVETDLKVAYIGVPLDLTYKADHLGLGNKTLMQIMDGSHYFCKQLKNAKNPLIIFGSSILKRADFSFIVDNLNKLNKNLSNNLEFDKYVKYTNVGLLNKDSNQVGSLELGIKSELSLINNFNLQKCKVLYLLGVDNHTYNKYKTLLSGNSEITFIYQGSHDISGSSFCKELTNNSHIILPSTTFLEKMGTFINIEGRVQVTSKVINPLQLSREDTKILRALSFTMTRLKTSMPSAASYDVLESKDKLPIIIPRVNSKNQINHSLFAFDQGGSNINSFLLLTKFNSIIEDFYLTSTLTKASFIMNASSISLRKESTKFIK